MRIQQERQSTGFTLVEVIITLLVAVILGSVMVQYLGSALSRSSQPIKHLAAEAALRAAADSIVGDFRQKAPYDLGSWNDFQAGIGAAGTDQNNVYGQYHVLFNDYIQFDGSGNEAADVYGTAPDTILKIVIAGTSEDPLTLLLIR